MGALQETEGWGLGAWAEWEAWGEGDEEGERVSIGMEEGVTMMGGGGTHNREGAVGGPEDDLTGWEGGVW